MASHSDRKDAFAHCLALCEAAGLPDCETGQHAGRLAILVAGKPVALASGEDHIVLICGFEGRQVLLQTNPEAYDHPQDDFGEACVLADVRKISDEELALHLAQAARAARRTASGEKNGERG